MAARKPRNYKRKRIQTGTLLQYKDLARLSERNIGIVEQYAAGGTLAELSAQYGITKERVAQNVETYIRHCLRLH